MIIGGFGMTVIRWFLVQFFSSKSRGHLIADIDPLGIQNPESKKLKGTSTLPPEVVVRTHFKGISDADMNKEFDLGKSTRIGGGSSRLTLKEIIARLNSIYCGHIGLEYAYITDFRVLDWLRQKFETPGIMEIATERRKWIWKHVMKAVTFESFLAKKFGSEKRFGLEGCESFIPAVAECLETSSENGVETVGIGIAHRGRLNTLVNICRKPMSQLFSQFNPIEMEGSGSGDVKYHLGTYSQRLLERAGRTMRIAIMANPSHLEAVNPVVVGRIRAEQVANNDTKGVRSLAILVHGDAAYAGQGICFETAHFTNLSDYTTGGVLHFVINNQIGFTTDPRYSRSSPHCTDVARVVNAPIFHVHADDPDAVVYCSKVASEYRANFHNDVVLDIVGYRRNGHNEMDEPMLTQPLMYKRIKQLPNVLDIYSEKLLGDGILTESEMKRERDEYLETCESEFKKAQETNVMHLSDWYDSPWSDFFENQNPNGKLPPTGVDLEDVKIICNAVSTPPEDIEVHKQVTRVMSGRRAMTEAGQIDWALGECLAFASLLKEGHHVRLSGEDVERGTFSHRQHIIHDQSKDMTWKNILHDIFPGQSLYTVSNSSLSEYGVCGFELGYSAYDHDSLTIWEAQFGDFANTCQVILDSLLCSGQAKWGRQVGLVLLLPHGMEGQGPEHSSARLERFLQLCDDDCTRLPDEETAGASNIDETAEETMTRQLFKINWIVCNPTTPANMFHLLRRQILMPFRKPLVVMTPKSLLRHPEARSNFDEITNGTSFVPVIGDRTADPGSVKKIIFCSGKVYYDLAMHRAERGLENSLAIVRIEQLCPFPYNLVAEEAKKYPNPKVMWVQEEHKNQGAYYFARDRIALTLRKPIDDVAYGGRATSASPATGNKFIFKKEFEQMIEKAMEMDR
ncbi:2-oxoglutarate dehydrogenase complex component E1-like [Athalia rosae]|uniref:2-oxoglutarate dehydrogenase complex component E1-like n=1 Tax=Athalia rosae TaxID=37344 RepID=UPI002033612D|nr:2-oxoglutarate dehydrogenase complex component E1-like [Athalia rosae]